MVSYQFYHLFLFRVGIYNMAMPTFAASTKHEVDCVLQNDECV